MAKPYPDWVPQEALDYFESLPDPFSREPKYDPEDAEVLRSAINSVNMKSAWLSIERRRSKASPKEFAIAIVHVSCMSVFKQMEQT